MVVVSARATLFFRGSMALPPNRPGICGVAEENGACDHEPLVRRGSRDNDIQGDRRIWGNSAHRSDFSRARRTILIYVGVGSTASWRRSRRQTLRNDRP